MEEYQAMVERLQKDGPQVQAGDATRRYVVEKPDEFKRQTIPYNDKHYVLAYITPEMSLMNRPGQAAWGLKRAFAETQDAQRMVGFEFDATGGQLFGDLTGRNVHNPLGIVLDDKLIVCPPASRRGFRFRKRSAAIDETYLIQDRLIELMTDHTDLSREEVIELFSGTNYRSAEEVKKFGLISEIL